jgi:hypothetical protein
MRDPPARLLNPPRQFLKPPREAMAPMASDTLGLGERSLRSARDHLLQRGFLRCVHAGGRRPGDPAKFILTRPTTPVVTLQRTPI